MLFDNIDHEMNVLEFIKRGLRGRSLSIDRAREIIYEILMHVSTFNSMDIIEELYHKIIRHRDPYEYEKMMYYGFNESPHYIRKNRRWKEIMDGLKEPKKPDFIEEKEMKIE